MPFALVIVLLSFCSCHVGEFRLMLHERNEQRHAVAQDRCKIQPTLFLAMQCSSLIAFHSRLFTKIHRAC